MKGCGWGKEKEQRQRFGEQGRKERRRVHLIYVSGIIERWRDTAEDWRVLVRRNKEKGTEREISECKKDGKDEWRGTLAIRTFSLPGTIPWVRDFILPRWLSASAIHCLYLPMRLWYILSLNVKRWIKLKSHGRCQLNILINGRELDMDKHCGFLQ